jgi:hypothetical protein
MQNVSYSGRFRENALQLAKNGVLAIRLVVDLMTTANALDEPGLTQLSEFTLGSPYTRSGAARDLAKIELLVRVTEEKGENRPSALAEKDLRKYIDRRTSSLSRIR